MKKGIEIIVFFCLFTSAKAQNIGYMGAKYTLGIYGFGSSSDNLGIGGELMKGLYAERTILNRVLLFAEFGHQHRNLQKFSLDHTGFKVYDYQIPTVVKLARVTNYGGNFVAKDFSLGLKYFLSFTGSIAPLGTYLALQASRQTIAVNPTFIDADIFDKNNKKEYSIHLNDIKGFTFLSQSLLFGVGNTRIYGNKIISDFSIGIGYNIGNSTAYKFSTTKEVNYEVIAPSPQDYFKANAAFSFTNSRILWVKYKLGVLL